MVIFNDLRISDDKQSLIVDCFIENLNVYSGMYIKEIAVDYYKNVETSGTASEDAITIYENRTDDTSVKAVRACLTVDEIKKHETFGAAKLAGGLFYVFVTCEAESSAAVAALGTLPCGYDQTSDIGIVPDWELLYRIGLKNINDMAFACFDKCNDSTNFIQFLLLWSSLKLAMNSCEYAIVEDVWDRILKLFSFDENGVSIVNGCGCSNS